MAKYHESQLQSARDRSSVNHDVLFIADSHEIDAKIGFPLQWNGKCTWEFDQVSLNPKIFSKRTHNVIFRLVY